MANTAKSAKTPSSHCMSKVSISQITQTENLSAANPRKTAQKILYQSRVYIFVTSAILTSIAIGASLFALVTPSCDEGSLSVKLWAFEYQLTKKGSCSTSAK